MSTQAPIGSSNQPLGADGAQRRRFLLHHVPLGFGSAVVLALFMTLPRFDVHAYPHADIVSGTFPQEQREGGATRHAGSHTGRADHAGIQIERIHHAAEQAGRHGGAQTESTQDHGRVDTVPRADGVNMSLSRGVQRFTVATGYLGLGLLAVTLLLGPANFLLGRRNPVSTYLRRDVGIWTAIFSVVHVIAAVLIHVSHDSGVISSVVHFFVAEDGRLLTNSFGLGNWTGLAAVVIVLGLLATSSDIALRTLKARPWKWLQRLTYALFVLVILHAFFYGAMLRMTSPFSLLLVLSVIVVVVGQAMGARLWRRRYSGLAAVALCSFGVSAPSSVFAEQGRISPETASARSQENPDPPDGPLYDAQSETTFIGTVTDLNTGGPGRLGWLMRVHTFGFGHKSANETHLLLKTDTDTVRIFVGPNAFVDDRKLEIKEGDQISVTGSRVASGGSQIVLAREIRKDDIVWALRTAEGQPLWAAAQTEPRGFWTTTKIVLVVVAAKVALLLTVLRH